LATCPTSGARQGLGKAAYRSGPAPADISKLVRALAPEFRLDPDLVLALAGYNAGEGAVQRFQGVPPGETQDYVRRITGCWAVDAQPHSIRPRTGIMATGPPPQAFAWGYRCPLRQFP